MKKLISLTLSISLLMSLCSCAKSESESTKAMSERETVNKATESTVGSTVISSESKKQAGKPVVKKAVGEYDSYNDYYVYTPENTDIIPGDDYRNHTYEDLNEIQKHVDGDYPGGYLNIEDWLGGLGVDGSEITKDGDDIVIKNNNTNVSIEVHSSRLNYVVGEKIICTFTGGKPTTKNERVFLFRSTPENEFSYLTTVTAESVDVLEVFINSYTAGSTENPLEETS